MSTWTNTVPIFTQGNETKYTDMNKPLQALIDRTDWLKQQIEQAAIGQNLIGTFVNLDTGTAVGDAAYLNPSTGLVEPALAAFRSELAADGGLRLADSGFVLGIIVEKLNATSGRVWLNGTLEDQTLADTMLGVSADPGIYRLSTTNAGELTSDELELDILVLVYHGGGVMTLFDKRGIVPNHTHFMYPMNEAWLGVGDAQFDNMTKPVGAVYGYDLASDADIYRLFPAFKGMARVFGDGDLLLASEVVINDDNIWWVDASVPVPSEPADFEQLELAVNMPYTYGEPTLRGAISDTPDEINVAANQGLLQVSMVPWSEEVVAKTGEALVSLNGRTAQKAPVVTSVGVLGDLQKVEDSVGGVVISLGQGINTFIEPALVNLNNVVEANDGYYSYYAFPAGRDSFMLGRISLPYFADASLEAAVVAEVVGQSGGGAIPAIAVSHIAKPYPDTAQALTSAWDATFNLPTPAIAANNALAVEADSLNRFAVTSRGTIFLKLATTSQPSEDIKIIRFGVILYTV